MAKRMTARARAPVERIEIPERTWIVWAVSISLLIAFTRLLALRNSPLDLLPDEAQYWSWSRHLAFGYFSKPPLIAWLIRATTEIARSQEEWAVRLAAPLLHAATGIVLCFIGKAMFNIRVGFWSALIYATLPGVAYSGLVISTDVPLLFFWSLALLAMWHLWVGPSRRWAIVLGAALGLGFLSKYAMIYFLLGLVILLAMAPRGRLRPIRAHLSLAAAVAALFIAPNLVWNASHGWATVGHTAANANWGEGGGLHIWEALQFAGAQFGVFGPILLAALIWRVAVWGRDRPSEAERFLLAFACPVLVLMILQSGASRAHANWAAVAYIAATVLVVGWCDRIRRFWPVQASFGLHLALFAAFTMIFAGSLTVRLPKTIDIFHQMRGWKSLSELVWRRMGGMPDESLAAEDREVMAELDYNLRGRPFPLVMATGNGPPGSGYELDRAVTAQTGKHVLLVSRALNRDEILERYDTHKLLEEWTVSAGQGRTRHYYIYDLTGFKGP
jgi:hypothetical protein